MTPDLRWFILVPILILMLLAIRLGRERKRVQRNRLWLLSLDKAQLLVLVTFTSPLPGLDKQDHDGLVQLAFQSYPEGQKDAVVQRIAEHLIEPVNF